jgi:4a-hydroxytetrahydrobiopterin dehydratase
MRIQRIEICIDANDADLLSSFWTKVLGYVRLSPGLSDIVDPDGVGPLIWFQTVPEGKTVKDRLHLDVYVPLAEGPDRIAEVVRLGGCVLREADNYVVLADPEGNEFCFCWTPREPERPHEPSVSGSV